MPFFNYNNNKDINIDYNKYQPLSVVAVYAFTGKIKPLYIGLTDLYGNQLRVKIDSIKYTKENEGFNTYCCIYNNGYRQMEINLTFYIKLHIWVMENKL